MRYRCELTIGTVYINDAEPLIKAVEQAAMSSMNAPDAIRIRDLLNQAAANINKMLIDGK